MLLQSLLKKLKSQQSHQLIHADVWCLPIHTVNVTYKPVVRRQMDILMKMILISVQKAHFKSAQQISDILLVEHLFVQDLLTKMEKMGLIEKVEQIFDITEKGQAQLQSGVYEEDQEVATKELLYSPSHEAFLQGDIEEVLEYEDFPEEIYRYYKQHDEINISENLIIEEIRTTEFENDTDETNSEAVQISSVESTEFDQINDVPCIELILYDEKNDHVYARIWNTLLDHWDKKIEKTITEKEASEWKNKILNKK
ncbi:hypothetical protein CD30_12065 [Ureibacillus massiliensis 4400831 = CIP 108448 = CCUG 49529]|uniref:Uncharacterized protein n=1 Tax=Ureibacillus massiliensis 4400831 = CIP 108448 = CCUG 49529 TaxID=1211035 RepID=A0A0A3J057_9BACL|nr:hypothetical protein [Ureibacillus massiliensis]KGR90301.1 hypothetical protein CD30_12065 [Ureibacillus massiliensis 4400831 = CIP 108448 = CCUG 49529]